MSSVRSLCLALAASACVSSIASAADLMMAPPPVPLGAQERLEFGTGWYLRGDIGWSREKTTVIFADPNLGAGAKVQSGYSLTIGGGYKFNNWFRADLTYDYMRPTSLNHRSGNFTCYDSFDASSGTSVVATSNSCYAQQSGTISRHVFLANGYLDIGSWSGLTPYVGAGVGMIYGKIANGAMAWSHANGTPYTAPAIPPGSAGLPWTANPGGVPIAPVTAINNTGAFAGRQYNLAWALMAGLSYEVSPNARIDMGYRFLNLGKFGAGTKTATVNEFRMGMRYMID